MLLRVYQRCFEEDLIPVLVREVARAYRAASQAAADRAVGHMQKIGAAHAGGRSPRLVRAIANRKMALTLRMCSDAAKDARDQKASGLLA